MDSTMLNKMAYRDAYLPTKKMAILEIDQEYNVTAIRAVNTKFGAKIVVTIDGEYDVFLPPRIAKLLEANPDQLPLMIEAAEDKHLQLLYLGGRCNSFEFLEKEEMSEMERSSTPPELHAAIEEATSDLLKKQSTGHRSKKSKLLSSEEVHTFLNEAPNNEYLATKVALIFGVYGACRSNELVNVKLRDMTKQGNLTVVNFLDTETKKPRLFVISQEFEDIVRKYEALRPTAASTDRYFLNYQNGRCTNRVIGIRKFSSMPKQIATFLNLVNPQDYTGYVFRQISGATLLADSGANITTLKRHGGWKSNTVAEGYVKESIKDKTKIGNLSASSINISIMRSISFDNGPSSINVPSKSSTLSAASGSQENSELPSKKQKMNDEVLETSTSLDDRATIFHNCNVTIHTYN